MGSKKSEKKETGKEEKKEEKKEGKGEEKKGEKKDEKKDENYRPIRSPEKRIIDVLFCEHKFDVDTTTRTLILYEMIVPCGHRGEL